MKDPDTALCRFCESKIALPGSFYCCAGCEVLDDLKDQKLTHAPRSSEENLNLIKHYGLSSKNSTDFEVHVEPLVCEACLQSLVQLPQHFPSLRNIEWYRSEGVLKFEFPKGAEDPHRLYQFLERMKLTPRWRSPGDAKSGRQKKRTDILRLGVLGAITANMMLFAIPIYAGLDGPMKTLFEWIQFFTFLPAFFWGAIPFYRTAWVSTRLGVLSVDAPLVVAFVLGSVYSTYSLIRGEGELYFDSLSSFLFLILLSRTILESTLARHLEKPSFERFLPRTQFTVLRTKLDGTKFSELTPWQELRSSDRVLFKSGDRLPIDGTLLSDIAEFETSWMTGESEPSIKQKGARVQAGLSLISAEAEIQVLQPATQTLFSELVGHLKSPPEKLSVSLESKVGNILVLACFALSLGLFLFGSHLGFSEILRRSIALMIVACPCAVSFAAPLARAEVSSLAAKLGAWITRPQIWNDIAETQVIAFDKTGTLTTGGLSLSPHSPMVDDHFKKILLGLERDSKHPVAEAVRRAWSHVSPYEIKDLAEVPGLGVQGHWGVDFYEFKKVSHAPATNKNNKGLAIELRRNNEPCLILEFSDGSRDGLSDFLCQMAKEYQLYILSGDESSRAKEVAKSLGIPETQAFGDLTPSAKLEKIKELKPDMYLGDGTNDLLALQEAPISVSVGAATLEAQSASDILLLNGDISFLKKIFEMANELRSVIKRNFALALAYNVLAGAAALMGWINPLMAAILMPLMSLSLLLSTLLGTRRLREMKVS